MPSQEIEITGTDQLTRLARRFREAAYGDLQAQISAGLLDGTAHLKESARASALANLPRRGRLNLIIASAHMDVHRVGPMHVQLVAKGISQLARTNRGSVQHPVYGHRPRETQILPKAKDWFYRPLRERKDDIRRGILRAMHRTADKITS